MPIHGLFGLVRSYHRHRSQGACPVFLQIRYSKSTILDWPADPFLVHLAFASMDLIASVPKKFSPSFVNFLDELLVDLERCDDIDRH